MAGIQSFFHRIILNKRYPYWELTLSFGDCPFLFSLSLEFGWAFETFLMHELAAFRDYRSPALLSFWRSTSGLEVDFIIDDHTAIEAKAKSVITSDDLRSLEAIAQEYRFKRLICVCLEKRPRKAGKIEVVPYRDFLEEMWA